MASKRSAVRYSSRAFAAPTNWVRNQLPPKSPENPTLAKAVVKIARGEATRRSQANAIDNPAPAAAPSIAATVTFGKVCNAPETIRCLFLKSSTAVSKLAGEGASPELRAFIPLTSPPAQKAPPAPVNMTAPTSGSSASSGSKRSNTS